MSEEPIFLLIETSTEICSAAVWQNGGLSREIFSDEPRAHAANLAPMIQALMQDAGIDIADCAAVAVSSGPGSYTGLRVGASTAKGLCFGANKPLIAVPTLDILASMAPQLSFAAVVPMVDARRMEAYAAVYKNGIRVTDVAPVIFDADSFAAELSEGRTAFIGDAAQKASTVIRSANASFFPVCPHALYMGKFAAERYAKKEFEDVAYFEPFYLKEFVPGITKKSAL